MALIEMKFFSQLLGMSTAMNIILPESNFHQTIDYSKPFKFQTLYLLHGGTDDHTAWTRQTAIERYAQEHMVAVVMPNVDLSYYTDMVHGKNYWTFITEEVPLIAQRYFPLSDTREDNFVAGLSMGGYGSFKWALKKPEMFMAAASFSGTLDMPNLLSNLHPAMQPIREKAFNEIFGDYANLANGEEDLLFLATRAKEAQTNLPLLYQCCGTEDFTYDLNSNFRNHVRNLGLELHYEEGQGGHTWSYWDMCIQKTLAWFPLKRKTV
ncbi:esterase [Bacillus sp. AFS076308]|uniref:alpha/beta hydrolase n=1 Tax=Bacillus sp. AFS076308 TaxID=2033512 RepID=UPI000BF87D8B|nr:alpha/beta hydrolase family protein [Bacillus sp. AFS076308]PFO06334.1 esterase [Bacillus sp. AFS076308]